MNLKPQLASTLIIALILSLGPGCGWFGGGKRKDRAEEETSEQLLYRSAQQRLRSGNYDLAIEDLQRLEARFPFGRYAEQAQLELVYAHYMSFDLDAATAAANRFIRLHPQHPKVDYAYYLKGLAAYDRSRNMMDRLFKTDAAKRDASAAQESYLLFGEMLSKFPDSDYAADARQRMVHLRNLLARSELYVANYYMQRGAFVAAANRARYVVENFSRAQDVPDALALLVEANYRLGLEDAANDALRVLAHNYPRHDGFTSEGAFVLRDQIRNRDRSWLNLVTWGLLNRPRVPPPIQLRQPQAPEEEAQAATVEPAAPEAGLAASG